LLGTITLAYYKKFVNYDRKKFYNVGPRSDAEDAVAYPVIDVTTAPEPAALEVPRPSANAGSTTSLVHLIPPDSNLTGSQILLTGSQILREELWNAKGPMPQNFLRP